jgi:DNA primase
LIAPDKIEEIKNSSDIVEVISEYIELKKSGSNYKARCPFHDEKTGSFMVSPDKQIFHCFGCGAGGNVFTFVQKHENLNFVESVRLLARRSGITIEETYGGSAKFDEKEKIIAVNKDALLYFKECLAKDGHAKEYLKKREISDDTVIEFNIGYAPHVNGLYVFLRSKGHSDESIFKSWLCKKSDSGTGGYDIFRNRIIFPIMNVYNDPVAFGARVLDDSLPKYINSAETPAYSKGKNLYNLNNARKNVKEDGIVIVEGYMDAIALYSSGIKNVAASLGTALTADQSRLLKRYSEKAVLMYDMDNAGIAGASRGGENLFEQGVAAYVASFEGAKDPDEFIKKFGVDGLKEKVKSAKPYFDFRAEAIKKAGDMTDPYYKEKAVKELAALIGKAGEPVVRQEFIKRGSLLFDIPAGIIDKYIKGDDVKIIVETGTEEVKKPATMKEKGREMAERMIALIMLEAYTRDDRDILVKHLINKRQLLSIDFEDFKNGLYSSVFKAAEDIYLSGEMNVLDKLQVMFADNQDVQAFVSGALAGATKEKEKKKGNDTEDLKHAVDECFNKLENEKAQAKIAGLQEKIRQAESGNDFEKVNQYLREKREIQTILSQRGENIEQKS